MKVLWNEGKIYERLICEIRYCRVQLVCEELIVIEMGCNKIIVSDITGQRMLETNHVICQSLSEACLWRRHVAWGIELSNGWYTGQIQPIIVKFCFKLTNKRSSFRPFKPINNTCLSEQFGKWVANVLPE